MKITTPKIVTISDLVQWTEKEELELSPKYQRNSVWNEKAKSYLIDTVIRGLPIPPIFMRQKIDVTTKTTTREVIDGQQRVRAIIEYVVDENFAIKKSHNKEFGGKKYSDLEDEIKEDILSYEILAEVVVAKDESKVYDMFARLNSNNMVLNKQEIRNAKFWGEFKVLIYRLSSEYRQFLLENHLLSDNEMSRMKDSEIVNSWVILVNEGIISESPLIVDKIYEKYDQRFPESELIEKKIEKTMQVIEKIYSYLEGHQGCFNNKNYFYTLFCVVYHQIYGIKNMDTESVPRNDAWKENNIDKNTRLLIKSISQFLIDYENNQISSFDRYAEFSEFKKLHQSRTTNKIERMKRVEFLNIEIIRNSNEN